MTTNGSFLQQDQYKTESEQCPVNTNTTENTTGNSSTHDLNKDEVGWYFVQQFYTTLGQNPEKLHLFYGSNSQFVYGPEAESSPVSVGRDAIQERFKQLNFQEAKVRLSNVDSQASFENIVIQVIGEISHLSAEPKKFVQSFVLAQQSNGYFVLNDIFRLINDDLEEDNSQENHNEIAPAFSPEQNLEVPQQSTAAKETSPALMDSKIMESKIEETVESTELSNQELIITNGASNNEPSVVTVNETEITEMPESLPSEPHQIESEENLTESEKPQEPLQTAANVHSQYANKTHIQSTNSSKPLSWANRAAAAVGPIPKPALPAVTPKNIMQSQNQPAPSVKPVQTSNIVSNPQHQKDKENTPIGSGWQTAGENPKKQNKSQTIPTLAEKEITFGYVRNVTEKVDAKELRLILSSFGNLVYFDINRLKNCAFVQFATTEGYQAAANASPHQVSGESIYVEPRRTKVGYGGNTYVGGRGGTNQRGRSGFANRGRGSGASPRNRGQASNT